MTGKWLAYDIVFMVFLLLIPIVWRLTDLIRAIVDCIDAITEAAFPDQFEEHK